MSIYTYKEKHWLYQQMREQTADDMYYIYRLIKKNGETHSVNSNGVFFDLREVSDETLRELMVYYKSLRLLMMEEPFKNIT